MFHQHLGTSHRTGKSLTTPMQSLPRQHAISAGHPIQLSNFKIIDQISNTPDLQLLEQIYIHKLKPSINAQLFSSKLLITK